MKKTKIICTMGPNTENEDTLREMIIAGMDVARFNFSHGTHEEQLTKFNLLKKVREELNIPVAAMLDTKGPEIRTGKLVGGEPVCLEPGSEYTLTTREVIGDASVGHVTYDGLPEDVSEGDKILIDDGLIDSLDIVAVVTELMEAFDVELGVDDLTPENFNSVEAIEELIESKQS